MNRLLAIVLAFYLPHLLEEAITGMHDDPWIVAAYAPLAHLGARHAAYLVFQITFALGLVVTLLYAHGGSARRWVMGLLGLALLAEMHHPLRALVALSWNSGLATSLPLPFVAALVLHQVVTSRPVGAPVGASTVRTSTVRTSTAR